MPSDNKLTGLLGYGRDMAQGASNSIASNVSAPVDGLAWLLKRLGVPMPDNPVGGSDWMAERGLTLEPQNRLAGLLGETVGLTGPILAAGKAVKMSKSLASPINATGDAINSIAYQPQSSMDNASKSVKIYDPKPMLQRPFYDDYPQGAPGPQGGRLTADIDGRPLSAQYIAGRRVVGGMDEGIARGDTNRLADSLGTRTFGAPRSGPDLKGDAGRYVRNGDDRRIFIDQSLSGDDAGRVLAHEVGHGIDDSVFGLIGPKGSRIPTGGISKELRQIYSDLNSSMHVSKGKLGASPENQGYAANKTDSELMAEAIRAYMRDPNYIKTIAPKTAARIREYVNGNQNLNKVIQFNSAAGAGLLGSEFYEADK